MNAVNRRHQGNKKSTNLERSLLIYCLLMILNCLPAKISLKAEATVLYYYGTAQLSLPDSLTCISDQQRLSARQMASSRTPCRSFHHIAANQGHHAFCGHRNAIGRHSPTALGAVVTSGSRAEIIVKGSRNIGTRQTHFHSTT